VCVAVCCGLRFTTGTIPPPASALAAHCSPGKGPYPPLPTPSCLRRNASGPRMPNTRPLFAFFPPSSFHSWMRIPPTIYVCAGFFLLLCLSSWHSAPCLSSHLIRQRNCECNNDAAFATQHRFSQQSTSSRCARGGERNVSSARCMSTFAVDKMSLHLRRRLPVY